MISYLKKIRLLLVLSVCFINQAYAQPGAIDVTFNTADYGFGRGDGASGMVSAKVIQPDGKILIAGDFSYYNSISRSYVARINADGSLDATFNPGSGPNAFVNTIVLQSDGKILIGGAFTTYKGVTRNHIARLNADGTLDTGFNPGTGANSSVTRIGIQSDGKIVIGGTFTTYAGTARNSIARINADGTLDTSFDPGTGTNDLVYSIAFQSDGKILIGGSFTTYNSISKNRIVRLNTNGSIDTGFNMGTGASFVVYSIIVYSNDKFLIGGVFSTYNGTTRKFIARLNADGTLDTSFDPGVSTDNTIFSIALQSDGKILIGGSFTTFAGVARNNIARLNSDGSLDTSLDPGTGPNYSSTYVNIQTDGKIIIHGQFNSYNGTAAYRVTRINADGSLDTAFNPGSGAQNAIAAIVVQSNGKIIIGGQFYSYHGVPRGRIARLNADGTLDLTFNPGLGANSNIGRMALQSDGKIIITGVFTTYDGTARNYIARVNGDGSLDATFNPGTGANGNINSVAIQSDGKIVIGGVFTTFNGFTRNSMARLNADGSLDASFNPGTGANASVGSIAIQTDGKIVIAGYFTTFNGVSKNYITRLNSNGTLDSGFNIGTGTDNILSSVALQGDGKIIVVGGFTAYNGTARNSIARLNVDGSIDASFDPGVGPSNYIGSLIVQNDGKVIIGGGFVTFNGISRNYFARLNEDGTLDTNLDPGTAANTIVMSMALQSDSKILVGGAFTAFNGIGKNRLVRLLNDAVVATHHTIRGKIYTDGNADCIPQAGETVLPYLIVKATPGPYYGGSDGFGNYQLRVDPGTVSYNVTQQFNAYNASLYVNQCTPAHTVNLTGSGKDTCCFNFANAIKPCAFLAITIQNSIMRRCFSNNTFIKYSNYGDAAASGAEIKVEYPPYVIPKSSVPMWTSKSGNILTYSLGSIAVGTAGTILLTDSVICGDESIRSLTQCIKASISPRTNCTAEDPAWDKSSIKVTGDCQNDSAVFVIKNAGTGNMNGAHEYRIYVNDTLGFNGTFLLNANAQFIVKYPGEGNTIRLEADQHPLHPGKSRPRVSVENCGVATPGPNRTGFVTTAPQDDMDFEEAVTCNQIIDSYDPNDKQVIPIGIGTAHQVVPGQELEYTIRFQNTGTDTAFTVVVVDTIDAHLDPASFVEGLGSHPYTLEVSGKGQAVLTYTFDDIKLPDSTRNKAGSHGLFSFRITVPENTPVGTTIFNKAHIYFDFNSAIITNETKHTVGITVPEDLSKGTKVRVVEETVTTGLMSQYKDYSVKIYPNPTSGILFIETPSVESNLEFRLLNLLGAKVKTVRLEKSNLNQINVEGINTGMFIYELWKDGERKTSGMVQVK